MASDLKIDVDTAFARATLDVLRRLPADIRRKVSVALREEAKLTARDARAILKDQGSTPRSRSGDTARATRHKRGKGGLTYLVEAKAHPKKGPVALFLEGGTQRGGRRVTQRTREFFSDRKGLSQLRIRRRSVRVGGSQRNPAYPFITAALANRQTQIERNLADAIADAIEEAARRAGG